MLVTITSKMIVIVTAKLLLVLSNTTTSAFKMVIIRPPPIRKNLLENKGTTKTATRLESGSTNAIMLSVSWLSK